MWWTPGGWDEDFAFLSRYTSNGDTYFYEYVITSSSSTWFDQLVDLWEQPADAEQILAFLDEHRKDNKKKGTLGLSLDKNISHVIIEVCHDVTEEDQLFAGSLYTSHSIEGNQPQFDDFSSSGQGKSNPGIPFDASDPLHGMKLDLAKDTGWFYFAFESLLAPTLGHFYSKSGKYKGQDTYAFNSQDCLVFVPGCSSGIGFVAPLPAPAMLVGLGMGCVALGRLRRRLP